MIPWECNLCGYSFRAETMKKASWRRSLRVSAAHKDRRAEVNQLKKRVSVVEASSHLPLAQRAWECAKCKKGLPFLSRYSRDVAIKHHLAVCCPGTTGTQNRLESGWWCGAQALSSKMGVAARRKKAFKKLVEVRKRSSHKLFWSNVRQGNHFLLVCRSCFKTWQGLSAVCGQECPGRQKLWPSFRWRLWLRLRLENSEALPEYVKACRMNQGHVDKLERCMLSKVTAATRRKLPPLQATIWIKDLTMDEDVEEHPGPSTELWSCNVGSFFTHGSPLLELADKKGVDVVALQEVNLGKQSIPGVARCCARRGWQFAAVPKPCLRGKGGVGIAVRSPWACMVLDSHACHEGQLLMVEVGRPGAENLVVIVGYRRPGAQGDMLQRLSAWLSGLRDRKWTLAVDWNLRVDVGRFAQVCGSHLGTLVCKGRHCRGSYDIDAVVVGHHLLPRAEALENKKEGSDHEVLSVRFGSVLDDAVGSSSEGECRFASHRGRADVEVAAFQEDGSVPWLQVACSDQAWDDCCLEGDVEKMWHAWSRDAETWLGRVGVLRESGGEVARGSVPVVRPGGSRKGFNQPVAERKARRLYPFEAHMQDCRQGRVDPHLKENLRRSGSLMVRLLRLRIGKALRPKRIGTCLLWSVVSVTEGSSTGRLRFLLFPGLAGGLRKRCLLPVSLWMLKGTRIMGRLLGFMRCGVIGRPFWRVLLARLLLMKSSVGALKSILATLVLKGNIGIVSR